MTRRESDQEFVDRAIRTLSAVRVSPDLMRRIAELPLSHPKREQSWFERWLRPRVLLPVFAAASAVLGVATGFVTEDLADSAEVASVDARLEESGTWSSDDAELAEEPELDAEAATEDSVDGMLALAWGAEADAWDTAWSTE